jgi:hypothetical protein
MVFRLLVAAIEGLLGKPGRDGEQISKQLAIALLVIAAVLVVLFAFVLPHGSWQVLRAMRHILR